MDIIVVGLYLLSCLQIHWSNNCVSERVVANLRERYILYLPYIVRYAASYLCQFN